MSTKKPLSISTLDPTANDADLWGENPQSQTPYTPDERRFMIGVRHPGRFNSVLPDSRWDNFFDALYKSGSSKVGGLSALPSVSPFRGL